MMFTFFALSFFFFAAFGYSTKLLRGTASKQCDLTLVYKTETRTFRNKEQFTLKEVSVPYICV